MPSIGITRRSRAAGVRRRAGCSSSACSPPAICTPRFGMTINSGLAAAITSTDTGFQPSKSIRLTAPAMLSSPCPEVLKPAAIGAPSRSPSSTTPRGRGAAFPAACPATFPAISRVAIFPPATCPGAPCPGASSLKPTTPVSRAAASASPAASAPMAAATQRILARIPATLNSSGTSSISTPRRASCSTTSGGPVSCSPSTKVGSRDSRPSAEILRT